MGRRTPKHILVRAAIAAVLITSSVGNANADETPLEPGVPPPPSTVGPAPEDEDADLDGFESDVRPSTEPDPIEAFGRDPRESTPRRRLERYPVRVPDRPLNLPSWWLTGTVGLGFAPGRVCVEPVPGTFDCKTRQTTHLVFAASYGFSRWLTVETRVAMRVLPDLVGDPFSTRLRFRLLDRGGHRLVFDVVYGQALVSRDGMRRFYAGPYAALRISPRARFRLGADFGFATLDDRLDWTLGVPLALDLAPTPRLILRLETRASLLGPLSDTELAWELPAAIEIGGVVTEVDGRPALEFYARGELANVGPNVSVDRWMDYWSVTTGIRFIHAQLPPERSSRSR